MLAAAGDGGRVARMVPDGQCDRPPDFFHLLPTDALNFFLVAAFPVPATLPLANTNICATSPPARLAQW